MNPLDQITADGRDRLAYADLRKLGDEEVMRALQAGNTDAFAVVFKRFHRLVHVTALRILRDAGEAEDLTQSIFLEIYRVATQFDSSKGTLKVWLLQYAYHRSISRRNYLTVRHFYDLADRINVEEPDTMWSAPLRLSPQETSTLVSEALTILPADQRRTIEMVFFEGLTFKEIAAKSSDTFWNVRHHYYRGLEKLRAHLEIEPASKDAKSQVLSFGEVKRVDTRAF
jgi:RNA polymerase sigma-70 factor (ECF subfamily)